MILVPKPYKKAIFESCPNNEKPTVHPASKVPKPPIPLTGNELVIIARVDPIMKRSNLMFNPKAKRIINNTKKNNKRFNKDRRITFLLDFALMKLFISSENILNLLKNL